jgi:hypothetical protein
MIAAIFLTGKHSKQFNVQEEIAAFTAQGA